jgi:transposase-like protein
MTDIKCKKCGSNKHVKNGNVRGEQRYLCKECGCNFIEIDRRVRIENAPLKALCVLLYSLCKGTFRGMGEVCGVAHTSVYRWVKTVAEGLPEPEITAKIQDIEIDEMWHFLRSKKTNDGSSRQWIVGPAILSHGLSVVVILQQSKDFTPNLST